VKSNINPVEVHPQLSNKGHPADGTLVGAGSLCPYCAIKLSLTIHITPLTLLKISIDVAASFLYPCFKNCKTLNELSWSRLALDFHYLQTPNPLPKG
jgi:hypothetical protein